MVKMTKKTVKSSPKKLTVAMHASERKDLGYEKDFFKWTKAQAHLLKQGKFEKLDLDNLIEEIESLGRSDKRSLKSHCIVLLQHMLKVQCQPNKKTPSWDKSIRNARIEIALILEDSPSLKEGISEIIEAAYSYAKQKAMIETGLEASSFPEECPWGVLEILPDLRRRSSSKRHKLDL